MKSQRPAPATPDVLLTPADVAEVLRLHKQTVYGSDLRHILPWSRVNGRSLRLRKADLDAYLQAARDAA